MNAYLRFGAKSFGDAESHLIACRALVDVLQTDPRVEALYEDWRTRTGLGAAILSLQRAKKADARDAAQAELLLTLYGADVAMMSYILPPFVSKELRLPYPWLSIQLTGSFHARLMREITGDGHWRLVAGAVAPPKAPAGRRAKGGGESIRRNVEWFYRVHVQQPPESIRSLAGAYARVDKAKRQGDGRSIVQEGIARAKALLDRAEYVYTPLPK